MAKSKAVDFRIQTNRTLLWHKILSSSLALLASLATVSAITLYERPPIVVVERKTGERDYFSGAIGSHELDGEDVKGFVALFVKTRYTWDRFDPKEIAGRLRCLGTPEFLKVLEASPGQGGRAGEDGERVEQYAAFVKPSLHDGKPLASFDRVVRVNGIPIASPTEISLHIVQGARIPCNPKGLYVDATTEYGGER